MKRRENLADAWWWVSNRKNREKGYVSRLLALLYFIIASWEPPSLSQSPPKETHTERLKVEMPFDERDFIHCDSQKEWKMEVKSPQVQCQSLSSSSSSFPLLFSPSLFSLFSSVCFLPPPVPFDSLWVNQIKDSLCCPLHVVLSFRRQWSSRCSGREDVLEGKGRGSFRLLQHHHRCDDHYPTSILSIHLSLTHDCQEKRTVYTKRKRERITLCFRTRLRDRLLTPLMLQVEDLHQSWTDIISGKTRTECHEILAMFAGFIPPSTSSVLSTCNAYSVTHTIIDIIWKPTVTKTSSSRESLKNSIGNSPQGELDIQ